MRRLFSTLYILSNLLDLSFTIYGITLTGPGMEVNLVAQGILLSHGFAGLSIFKLAGVTLVLVIAAMLARKVKYLDIPVLLVGSLVSLVGAYSWLCVF